MRTYDFTKNYEKLLTPDIVALLTQIHEYKGEQALFIEAKADTLTKLVEIAKIQSTESSNKIEGIYTSDERLKKLVQDKTTPRTRNEQEIAGYRDVLATIHESFDYIPPKASMILQLHRDLYKFSGASYGGHYKTADNVIAETDAQGNKSIRFQPLPAWETPETVSLVQSRRNYGREENGLYHLGPVFHGNCQTFGHAIQRPEHAGGRLYRQPG